MERRLCLSGRDVSDGAETAVFVVPIEWSCRVFVPLTAITLGLTHPNAKAILRTAQFTRDRCHRHSFAFILNAVFQQTSHLMVAELG